MDDIFVYCVPLPDRITEMVTPCLTGYTIYINNKLDEAHALKAYQHALGHIIRNDFEKPDADMIESEAHK